MPERPDPAAPLVELRHAACLAHSVPGVALRLQTDVGYEVVVSHGPIDTGRRSADLTPCQFRSLVATASGRSVPLIDRIIDVEIAGAIEHLGGGVFRASDRGREQRWITTLLDHDTVIRVLSECPVDLPVEAMAARVAVDTVLDAAAVCITAAHAPSAARLDEVAFWAQSACLVAELIGDPVGQRHP